MQTHPNPGKASFNIVVVVVVTPVSLMTLSQTLELRVGEQVRVGANRCKFPKMESERELESDLGFLVGIGRGKRNKKV